MANETNNNIFLRIFSSEAANIILLVIIVITYTYTTTHTKETLASKSFEIKSKIGDKTVSKNFFYTKEQELFSSVCLKEEKLIFKHRLAGSFEMPPPLTDSQQLQITPAKRRRKREDPQSCTTPEVRNLLH